MSDAAAGVCRCGTDLAPELLACPVCHRLVHSERLSGLVNRADGFETNGDVRAALGCLRESLTLLPPQARQYISLQARTARLSDLIDSGDVPPTSVPQGAGTTSVESGDRRASLAKVGAAVGGFGLIAWKFKFIAVFLATKAKLLFLGLSKSTTLISMLLSLGLYWTLWGWRFALGLVLSIYVHEMGHVAALRRFGIPASAPMFLPGLGAVVRMKAYPQTAREDARIGLAGPIWGLGAAVSVACAYWATGWPILAAIASVGAWINLFNLVPIWQLDGGRGFRALSKQGRWGVLAVVALLGVATQEGLYILIGLAGVFRAFSGSAPAVSDRRTLLEYCFLLVTLGALATLPVPTG